MKNIIQLTKIAGLAVILSLGLSYVYAWTAPIQQPPAGNVAAPINTSGSDQTKTGILRVVDFVTNKITFTDGTTQTTATNGGSHGKQRFTTVGNGVCPSATNCFTVPAGVTTVWVSMSGGGGAGGSVGGSAGVGKGGDSIFSIVTATGGGPGGGNGTAPGNGGVPGGERGSYGDTDKAGSGGGNIFGTGGGAPFPAMTGVGYDGNIYGGGGSYSTNYSLRGGGGGGGGGAVLAQQITVVPSTSYPVTVGKGGVENYNMMAGSKGAPGFVLVEW